MSNSRIVPLRQFILLGFVNIVIIVIIAVFSFYSLIPSRDLRFDFYPRWVGGRALWNGQSPYENNVTNLIQTGMFGGLLPDDADQQRFAYPAYTGLLIAPLLVLPPQMAIAVWVAIQFWSILITPLIWLKISNWQPSSWLLVALMFGLVFVFRYPINLFIIGQFTGLMLVMISLGILLLLQGRDVLAGIAFALSTMPPTISVPFALIVLGGYSLKGRWKGLLGFAGTLTILTGITFALIGWWIPDFLHQISDYSRYAFPVWAPGIFDLPVISLFVVCATIAWLLWNVRDFVWKDGKQNQIQFALAALITALILFPQTGNYYLVLLIPPIMVATKYTQAINGKQKWFVGGLIALAILSPWLYFSLQASNPNLPALLLPVHVGIILSMSFWLHENLLGKGG